MLGWAIAAAVYAAGVIWIALELWRAPIREDFADADDAYESEHFIDPETRGGR